MIDIRELRYSNAGPFPPPQNPPGSWTEYNFSNTPDQNGFTEQPDTNAVVNIVSTGPQADRRVEITPNGGNKVFITTDSPNLDPSVGATGEISVAVSAPNEFSGFEIRYLNGVINWVCSSEITEINIPGGFPNPDFTGTPIASQVQDVSGQNNTNQIVFRITVDSSRDVMLYRNGVLLFGPLNLPYIQKPSQTFMWWGEGG